MRRSAIFISCLMAIIIAAGFAGCGQEATASDGNEQSAQQVQAPEEQVSFSTETGDIIPLYLGATENEIPDDIQQVLNINKITNFKGYLVPAELKDIMAWYREHMPDWELQNEATSPAPYKPDTLLGVQYFKKDSQGIMVFTHSNHSEGKTLLVIASGYSNIECCSRQVLGSSEGDNEEGNPEESQIAPIPLLAESADDVVIVANPINLSQIKGISKFRSGAGHWYSTSNFLGEPEPPSNMKHYVAPIDTEQYKMEVYAPFDGEIVLMEKVDRGPNIDGGWQFFIEQRPYKGWVFSFCHININDGLVEGSMVKAGEFLGYATLDRTGDTFDLSLQGFSEPGVYKNPTLEAFTSCLDSIFNHMSSEVYQEFVDYGFNKENMIISRDEREKHPLSGEGEPNTTSFYFTSDSPDVFSENFVLSNKFR